jgi:hypothetical protein
MSMVIQQYRDPSVKRYLKLGYWYQEHVRILRNILIGSLVAIIVILWSTTIYGAVKLVIAVRAEQKLFAELVQNRPEILDLHQARAPLGLLVGDVFIVPSTNERNADFGAFAENKNTEWIITASYSFSWNGKTTEEARVVIPPGEKTLLATVGVKVSSFPKEAQIEISLDWSRILDAQELLRAQDAIASIIVSDERIVQQQGSTRASYTISNRGIYTLVNPEFMVMLSRSNNKPIALARFRADILPAQDSITAEHRWLSTLPTGTNITVYPSMDFFSEALYRLPEGSAIQF